MKKSPPLFSIIFAFLISAACKTPQKALPSGIDIAGMDKSVRPGDDFHEYVNGGWLKATPIPPDKARYGVFTMLADEVRKRTRTLIEQAAASNSNTTDESRKIGDFYSSFMNEGEIESKG